MNITIVGGGNVGTQFAVHCAEKGHNVTIFTSKPNAFSNELFIVDEENTVLRRGEARATNDAAIFSEADLIFVTTPSFMAEQVAEQIIPRVRSGTLIGFIPGTGGMECVFRSAVERGCILFGLQRVPSVARLKEYGRTVCAVGYRDKLHVSAIPFQATERCRIIVEDLLSMPCAALPCYLNLTLTPSNPILHTTRLRTLFKDYHKEKIYSRVPLFYEEWDNESAERVFACDDEVQQLCKSLSEYDLSAVKSLKEHYESNTPDTLTQKIRSIVSFRGILTPMVTVDGGYVPDFNSRYFTADFPYGLAILRQISAYLGVKTPAMDDVYGWYEDVIGDHKKFNYRDYSIIDKSSFINFYSK